MRYLFMLFVVSLACLAAEDGLVVPQPSRVEEQVGHEMFEAMEEADAVVVSRYSYEGPHAELEVTAEQVDQLRDLLLCDDSYHFEVHKSSVFIPEYEVQFQGEANVTVLLDVAKSQVKFVSGESVVMLDSDPVQDQLKALFQEIDQEEAN